MSRLFDRIRKIVAEIPGGKVTTYGAVARATGTRDSRKVGYALYGNNDPKIPCHRVVKKDGFIAEDYSLGGWEEQKARLLAEGVPFLGEKQVDLNKCFWSPSN